MTQIRASNMLQFYKCPASYQYGTLWEPVMESPGRIIGTEAHALMVKDARATPKARAYSNTFKQAVSDHEFTLNPEWQEIQQTFEIRPGIELNRTVDAIATIPGDVQILVDWKTSSDLKYWPKIFQAKTLTGYGNTSPKAENFQAVAYLIPPPQKELDRLGLATWPTTICFVIGTTTGETDLYYYTRNREDYEEFISAARLMVGAINNDLLPRSKGEACGVGGPMECAYMHVCYEVKNWERLYTKKEKKE